MVDSLTGQPVSGGFEATEILCLSSGAAFFA
jgi:hypothetical protein